MVIDIPVTIAFDFANCIFERTNGATSRTFTMRYDSADTVAPAKFCTYWPPQPGATWFTDKDGILFMLLSEAADREITRRAEADPETYAAKEHA
jgi:hypothetical protein